MSWASITKKNLPETTSKLLKVSTASISHKRKKEEETKVRYVDIGANLSHRSLSSRLPQVLTEAYATGVSDIVITGTSVKGSQEAIKICRSYAKAAGMPKLKCTVGIHPHDATRAIETGIEKVKNQLVRMINENLDVVVAVGECGLDYDRMFSKKEDQKAIYSMQIEIASKVNLPLFLHERNASDDFLTLWKQTNGLKGVVHCFTGTREEMREYLSLGFFIGITGFVCDERRGKNLRNMIHEIPLERLMIETDAPFMTPHNIPPPKPKNNEPKFLEWVSKGIADARGVAEEVIAIETTKTAHSFFQLLQ